MCKYKTSSGSTSPPPPQQRQQAGHYYTLGIHRTAVFTTPPPYPLPSTSSVHDLPVNHSRAPAVTSLSPRPRDLLTTTAENRNKTDSDLSADNDHGLTADTTTNVAVSAATTATATTTTTTTSSRPSAGGGGGRRRDTDASSDDDDDDDETSDEDDDKDAVQQQQQQGGRRVMAAIVYRGIRFVQPPAALDYDVPWLGYLNDN